MAGAVLGHIDCPACGLKAGMRVTLDKNQKPFGYCEANCNAQLRIGGNPVREAAFIKMYPWAKSGPVTVAEQGRAGPAVTEAAQVTVKPAKPGFNLGGL